MNGPLAIVVTLLCGASLHLAAQETPKPCPTKPGLYAASAKGWSELPREPDPVSRISPGFMTANVTKELPGEKAFTTLTIPVEFCAVGASNGSSFHLEKVKVKKGVRLFVQSGNFHEKGGAQSQNIASITDDQGNVHLLTNGLTSGQFVLVMHGAFAPPAKPIVATGNAQADAANAAIASTTALTQSLMASSMSSAGILFGFGIN